MRHSRFEVTVTVTPQMPDPDPTASPLTTPPDFPSLAFFERIVAAVGRDPVFHTGTEHFDGSVLFAIGDYTIWMKWYRGGIIDIHEGADPLGYTFALRAPLDTWTGIWELPRASYRPWARLFNFGDIATDGNGLEATRVRPATFAFLAHMEADGGGA